MLINRLKSSPAFRADAPPQIRHAIALFAIVWLIDLYLDARLIIIGLPAVKLHPDGMAGLLGGGCIMGFWLVLNGCLIAGLCARQKMARLLELVLTIATTLILLIVAPQWGLNLLEISFLANAVATVLLFLPACSHWFGANAAVPE